MTLYEAHAMLRVNLFCVMEISTEPDVQVITISQKPTKKLLAENQVKFWIL